MTDVWFRTDLDLETLGRGIGMNEIEVDAEDYWEWITGNFRQIRIDVTRSHAQPAHATDTRIFILSGADAFDLESIEELVSRLHALHIDPIYLGRWTHLRGNDFTRETFTSRRKA